MIIDAQNMFDSALALTATANSTNTIDLVNPRDIGVGGFDASPTILVLVNTPMLSAGATTLTVAVTGSTDNSTFDTMIISPAIAKANLIPGTGGIAIRMPSMVPGQVLPRYLRLTYTVATGPFTGGTLSAFLLLDRQRNFGYPAGTIIVN